MEDENAEDEDVHRISTRRIQKKTTMRPPRSLVSPKRGAVGVGIGLSWGEGIPFVEHKNKKTIVQVPSNDFL